METDWYYGDVTFLHTVGMMNVPGDTAFVPRQTNGQIDTPTTKQTAAGRF